MKSTVSRSWAPRIAKIGPARSIRVHSCMLMSDIARKVPSDTSATSAIAGFRAGHSVPVIRGHDLGRTLVRMMPANRQVTNIGNLRPAVSSPKLRSRPKMMLRWIASIASRRSR